ncbi:MAG TPA: hypothetical protein VIF15_17665 [Polyangiaceae bacterium]
MLVACAVLPLTASAFAYAVVEKRHRRAWTGLSARPPLRLGAGPYRHAELPPARFRRAPLLVRAAALGCFYWGWFGLLMWLALGFVMTDVWLLEIVVLGGIAAAASTCRLAVRLLRRDAGAFAFGRRVALWTAFHATAVSALAFAVGGVDWSGPAAVFTALTVLQSVLVVTALRRHALLFAQLDDAEAHAREALPTWLARMVWRRQAQRRANFFTRASHTIPGA